MYRIIAFVLPTPNVGATGQSARSVMLDLVAITNPDGVQPNFNTGVCRPNSTTCNPPNLCEATQVSSPTPFPVETFYRHSVAITVKGN